MPEEAMMSFQATVCDSILFNTGQLGEVVYELTMNILF